MALRLLSYSAIRASLSKFRSVAFNNAAALCTDMQNLKGLCLVKDKTAHAEKESIHCIPLIFSERVTGCPVAAPASCPFSSLSLFLFSSSFSTKDRERVSLVALGSSRRVAASIGTRLYTTVLPHIRVYEKRASYQHSSPGVCEMAFWGGEQAARSWDCA